MQAILLMQLCWSSRESVSAERGFDRTLDTPTRIIACNTVNNGRFFQVAVDGIAGKALRRDDRNYCQQCWQCWVGRNSLL